MSAAAATISGNGAFEEEDADESCARYPVKQPGLERAPPDPQQRLDDDHQHRRLDSEQRAVDPCDAAPERVKQAQAQHHQCAWQHEKDAGDEAAAHAVQRPADVCGELLRLRPGQQHAEIECMQKSRLIDPLFLVDQHAVHHGDLPGRPAEIDAAELEPQPECFAEARRSRRRGGRALRLHRHLTPPLRASCAAPRLRGATRPTAHRKR